MSNLTSNNSCANTADQSDSADNLIANLKNFLEDRASFVIKVHEQETPTNLRNYFGAGNTLKTETERLLKHLRLEVEKAPRFGCLAENDVNDLCMLTAFKAQHQILDIVNDKLCDIDDLDDAEMANFYGRKIAEYDYTALPDKPPKKYRRVEVDGAPLKYLETVYLPWLKSRALTKKHQIIKLDPTLVTAIYNYKKKHKDAGTLKTLFKKYE